MIHRDIKPSNLLLSRQGQVKVLDLGLARLLADGPEARQLTQSGQVRGKPDYMAPEHWDNTHTVDHRADLYALGCTLCFLLTGRGPQRARWLPFRCSSPTHTKLTAECNQLQSATKR